MGTPPLLIEDASNAMRPWVAAAAACTLLRLCDPKVGTLRLAGASERSWHEMAVRVRFEDIFPGGVGTRPRRLAEVPQLRALLESPRAYAALLRGLGAHRDEALMGTHIHDPRFPAPGERR